MFGGNKVEKVKSKTMGECGTSCTNYVSQETNAYTTLSWEVVPGEEAGGKTKASKENEPGVVKTLSQLEVEVEE